MAWFRPDPQGAPHLSRARLHISEAVASLDSPRCGGESGAVIADGDPNLLSAFTDRNSYLGSVGMAGTVAECLSHDIQDFSLFFLGQHLDGGRLKIQGDAHLADLIVDCFQRLEMQVMKYPMDSADSLRTSRDLIL